MFGNITDYRFINQSSLNDIVIDGGIMPLRPSADKRIVRGEDVAFITECEAERSLWWKSATYTDKDGIVYTVNNDAYTKLDFTKSISANQISLNDFNFEYRSLFYYNDILRSIPSEDIIIRDWTGRAWTANEAYKDTFIDGGFTLSFSDYESEYMTGHKPYILSRPYIEGRFNNLSKAVASFNSTGGTFPSTSGLKFIIQNSHIPYTTQHVVGSTTLGVNQLWEIYSSQTEIMCGVLPARRILRVEIDGENADVIDSAQLWAFGVYSIWERTPGGFDSDKSVAYKLCNGSKVSEGGKTYIDFSFSVSAARALSLATECGHAPSVSTNEVFYYFSCEYSVLVKFSNRTKWV